MIAGHTYLNKFITGSLSRKNAQAILLQHVVLGTHFSPAFKDGQELTTAAERELLVGVRNGEWPES